MKKTILEVKKLSKTYQKKYTILKNINYKFKSKTFYLIKGENSCGKTTLMKILATIISPSSGEIFIEGKNIKDLTKSEKLKLKNQTIGYVFQDYNLNEHLTIQENIMIPMYQIKKDKKEIAENVLSILYTFNMLNIADNHPNQVSESEKQLAAIIRAIINGPQIIIADEPTLQLDSKRERLILRIFRRMADRGKCIIISSQSNRIDEYADQILEIKDNKLVESNDK